jgi:type IV pilus assembly protein PilO
MAKSFHQLAPRSQSIVFGLLCVVTVGAGWQVLVGPEREELATRQARLADVQSQLTAAQAVAKKLSVFEKEVAQMEQTLRETTAVLPDEKDPQDVLRNLHDLASDSALNIDTFTPKVIATKAQYSEWPIELGLEGNYHDLGRFFDRVASAPRLMSVSELHIKVKPRADGHGSITASCVTTTFVFKRDTPTAGAPRASGAPAPATASGPAPPAGGQQ